MIRFILSAVICLSCLSVEAARPRVNVNVNGGGGGNVNLNVRGGGVFRQPQVNLNLNNGFHGNAFRAPHQNFGFHANNNLAFRGHAHNFAAPVVRFSAPAAYVAPIVFQQPFSYGGVIPSQNLGIGYSQNFALPIQSGGCGALLIR